MTNAETGGYDHHQPSEVLSAMPMRIAAASSPSISVHAGLGLKDGVAELRGLLVSVRCKESVGIGQGTAAAGHNH
jgi:hypothetical protein